MLKNLGRRLSAGLVAAVMAAVAAGITLVAAAFAAYAGLKMVVSPASASALTALVFAAVAGLVAVIAPKAIAGDTKAPHPAEPRHKALDPAMMGAVGEVGVAVLGVVADLALSHRLKRQQKARGDKGHKRR